MRGTPHPASLHRLVLSLGLLLSAAILGITAFFPLSKEPAAPLERVFDPVDRLVRNLQDEIYRVFAAISRARTCLRAILWDRASAATGSTHHGR